MNDHSTIHIHKHIYEFCSKNKTRSFVTSHAMLMSLGRTHEPFIHIIELYLWNYRSNFSKFSFDGFSVSGLVHGVGQPCQLGLFVLRACSSLLRDQEPMKSIFSSPRLLSSSLQFHFPSHFRIHFLV